MMPEELIKSLSNFDSFDSQSYLMGYGLDFMAYKRYCLEKISSQAVVLNIGTQAYAVLIKKEWDTKLFGFKVYTIDDVFIKRSSSSKEKILEALLKKIIKFVKKEKVRLLSFRFDVKYLSYLQIFEKHGFTTQDVMATFLHFSNKNLLVKKTQDVDLAKSNDMKNILSLSKDAFAFSRISTDNHFTLSQKNCFYSVLAKTILSKPDNFTLVSREGSQLSGYVTGMETKKLSRFMGKKLGCLWLISVSQQYRNKGIGKKLLGAFLNQYGKQVDCIEISTQVQNVAAMNLYARMGLIPSAYFLTVHYWTS